MNLTALQRNQKHPRQLSSYNINEPHILLSRERSKQGRSFVFVISPPAHGDRNVSKTLWLTKDRSTPRSQGTWEHCGKWLPCGHFEHAGPSSSMCCLLLSLSKGDFFSLTMLGSQSCNDRNKPPHLMVTKHCMAASSMRQSH